MRNLYLCSLLLIVAVGAGCADHRQDIEEMKRRLAMVEQATIANRPGQKLSKQIEGQSGTLADLRAEVDGMRFELQRVAGKYEEAAHQNEQLHELLTVMRGELEMKVSRFEEQLASRTINRSEVQTAAQRPVKPPTANAKIEYEKALKLIQKERRFVDGRKGLQRFLRDYPKHELSVNAFYWIGEAYYGEKQYEKAINQFQDVMQKFPKHVKAAAAQLKQALAFGALGDKGSEKSLLQKVVSVYPKSPEAKKAKALLQKK